MREDLEFSIHDDFASGDTILMTRLSFTKILSQNMGEIVRSAIDKITDHIAVEFVERHGVEIMAKLDQQAIANLSVAAAGAQINETLAKKMPDKILHHVEERVRTEVYQKGVFGGLKRLR